MGALPIKSINSGSASCNIGAFWTILLEMPVRLLMNWGIGLARIDERGELRINAVLVKLHSSNFDHGI